jgi:(R)-2-hydroxyacyl-CoA dehydratese activating ATPase
MITAGVDIGSTASKSVVLKDGKILAQLIGPSTTNPARTAEEIFAASLKAAGVKKDEVAFVVGTGYGRAQVPFANENISELSCHGRGAHFFIPACRTVLDIGGQDTKVISIDHDGNLLDFAMNDKCAAGTGRFLEMMCRVLGLNLDQLGEMHFQPGEPAVIGNMCSVFAESEVINLVNEGAPLPGIIKGLHQSLASRVVSLLKRVGIDPEVVITGGVAKNRGVIDAIESRLSLKLTRFPDGVDPQIMGALGAAMIAADHALKQNIK